MACSRYFGVSPVSRHLFITKNVKKHEKLQSPLNKWLSQGILSFHLFLDILSYSKVSKNRKTTKSLEFLHLLQFLHNSTKTSAAGARQGTRSVPVISVPSRNEAWEVYPLEMYYPDDPTRLCRPKAGQSLVLSKHLKGRSVPRVSHVFAHAWAKDFVIFLFLDTFRIQGILSFSCFQTLSVFKDFVVSAVSRHFLSVFKDRAERRRRKARRV